MIFKNLLIIIILNMSLTTIFAQTSMINQDDQAIEYKILEHINQYRHQQGLSSLKMNPLLVKEARHHSLDMAKHKIPFGHQGFLNRIARLRRLIPNTAAGAENVAYNYKNAQTVVEQWILSPGHKRNIKGNYNLTGVGIAHDAQGKIYFTQLFLHVNFNQHQSIPRKSFFGIPISFNLKGNPFLSPIIYLSSHKNS